MRLETDSPHTAMQDSETEGSIMFARIGQLRQLFSTRIPTQWGEFRAVGYEREIVNGSTRTETAIALILGDLADGAPLVRIHSQCFTSEVLGSLRCDCKDQL